MVYLVGAGPGDYKLLTLRGAELIGRAEVLVYDRLADEKLLSLAPEGCRLCYVGKSPGQHSYTQEEINALLVEEGADGKTVVRLKGGDPFIFGRGGEEALALKRAGIPFEVVPGISSFYSCPAYGGIPVTHRGLSTGFTVVTGRTRTDAPLDYETLARFEGTLVFLMGVSKLQEICDGLIRCGKGEDTPGALVHWGTTARQKTAVGTLETLPALAVEQGIANPSVIVIGDVVSLREQLAWIEKRPLFGKRILIPRSKRQAGELADKLYELGAEAVECPLIRIGQGDRTALDEALRRLDTYTWLFFTSENAVEALWNRMREKKIDVRNLYGRKLYAIGNRTRKALEERGLYPNVTGGEDVAFLTTGDRVLYPTSDLGGERVGALLDEAGVAWDKVCAYRNEPLEPEIEGPFDGVLLCSASQAERFSRLGGVQADHIFAIGPKTAKRAKELGLLVDAVAKRPSVAALLETVLQVLAAQ